MTRYVNRSSHGASNKKYWLLAAAAIIVLAVVLVFWQRHSTRIPTNITEAKLQAILMEAQPNYDLGKESFDALRQAERLDSKSAMVWFPIATQLCVAGYYEETLTALERSRHCHLPFPEMSSILDAWEGIALDALGRRQEAVSAYTRSLEMIGDGSSDTPWFVINRDWLQERLKTPFSPSMIRR